MPAPLRSIRARDKPKRAVDAIVADERLFEQFAPYSEPSSNPPCPELLQLPTSPFCPFAELLRHCLAPTSFIARADNLARGQTSPSFLCIELELCKLPLYSLMLSHFSVCSLAHRSAPTAKNRAAIAMVSR